MPLHGFRTGRVFLRDYDVGVMTSLGGTVQRVSRIDPATSDPVVADEVILDLPQIPSGNDPVQPQNKARVILKDPEQETQWNVFPRVVVSRDDVRFAPERWHPLTQEYNIVGPAAQIVTVPDPAGPDGATLTGPTLTEAKMQAWPYDLTYTIECWHRYREWAHYMIFEIMRRLPPYGVLFMKDSLQEAREYDLFQESGPTDLTEVLSLTDRGVGYSLSYRVTAELDLQGADTLPTVRFPKVDVFPSPPSTNAQKNKRG